MPNYSGIWTEQAVMQANGAGNWPNAPGAPTIGTATDTTNGGSVSVAFTAPTFAGLPAVITSYTVTSSPGGFTGTGASSPITVSGLTNGTAYTFTVTATNASGTSPASAASNSVTPSLVVYVEQMFSTYLYTGDGTNKTIVNGIDLSTKGGLTWIKSRNNISTVDHLLFDTARGNNFKLSSNLTAGSQNQGAGCWSSTTSGFTVNNGFQPNYNGDNYASWTFREQAKFFDIVTYTGNGSARTIAHNLGSAPGCIIVKKTNATSQWCVYHRGLTSAANGIFLNLTDAQTSDPALWNSTAPTSTVFSLGDSTGVNNNGDTYVAYLFAHDAGGFGLTGTDNVISCGSFTADSNGAATVSLGYEPQWVMIKRTDSSSYGDWRLLDTMRGWVARTDDYLDALLRANTADAEQKDLQGNPTATGFYTNGHSVGAQFIYIAVRKGPMKIPTVGTNVFSIVSRTGTGTTAIVTGAVSPPDLVLTKSYTTAAETQSSWYDRLRGTTNPILSPYYTLAEFGGTNPVVSYNMDGVTLNDSASWGVNISGVPLINYFMQRAPSYFDEVCYIGDGNLNASGTVYNVTHNLAAIPEMVIIKSRGAAGNWYPAVAISSTQWVNGPTTGFALNTTAEADVPFNFSTLSYGTTTTFRPAVVAGNTGGGYSGTTNDSGATYVAYLFATCPGVSKVGSYTGTGATQTINCGFTGGARFVLIKRTDSTGGWYYWDTTRGMVSGTNPSLIFNTSAAQVNANSVFTIATGFQVVSTAAGINANGGTFIFLAIA